MRTAVISDIHANQSAFEHVIKDMEQMGFDDCICLGDIVGYGPDPVECIEIIQKNNIECLMGNHDAAVCGLLGVEYFNSYARKAIDWTIELLSPEEIDFLKKLKLQLSVNNALYIHGALTKPFDYILNNRILKDNAAILKSDYPGKNICFFGHTHSSFISVNGTFEMDVHGRYQIADIANDVVFINPGSVGQPRGGNSNNASYCIFNTVTGEINFRSVQYDIDKTYNRIIKKGLPKFLGLRLYHGL